MCLAPFYIQYCIYSTCFKTCQKLPYTLNTEAVFESSRKCSFFKYYLNILYTWIKHEGNRWWLLIHLHAKWEQTHVVTMFGLQQMMNILNTKLHNSCKKWIRLRQNDGRNKRKGLKPVFSSWKTPLFMVGSSKRDERNIISYVTFSQHMNTDIFRIRI